MSNEFDKYVDQLGYGEDAKEEVVEEANKVSVVDDTALKSIADEFARVLIGDSNQGLKNLGKILPVKLFPQVSTSEYNKLYKDLFDDIFKALKRNRWS